MAFFTRRGRSRALLSTAAGLLLFALPGWSQTEGPIAVDVLMFLDPGTPDPVDSGGAVSWQARVGSSDQGNLSPGGLTVNLSAASQPAGVTITANGTDWACSINSCTYQLALPAGGVTSDLNIIGNAPATQQIGNIDLLASADVGAAFVDVNPQNNAAGDNVTVLPVGGPDYVISSFGGQPDPVSVNGQIDFTLIVANAEIGGKRPERGLSPPTVSFTLASQPNGAAFAGIPSGTNWTCGSTDCTFATALDPGDATTPLSIPVMAPATGPGSVTLSALVGGDSSPGNNGGDASVTVAAPPLGPDFAFRSIGGSPDPVEQNGSGQFVLVIEDAQITPRSPQGKGITAPSVSFTLDSAPSGVVLGTPSGNNWQCSGNGCDYTANVSPSSPTEPLTIPFSAPSSGPGNITLQAQILGDTNTANNQGQAQVAIAGTGALDLSFARFEVTPASVRVDEQIEYRVAIKNLGNRGFAAGDPGFSYSLSTEAGTATLLTAPSGSNWSCSAGSCSYSGPLNAGEVSSDVRFVVRAPAVAPTTVTLSGEIFGDANPGNNQGSATAQVEPAPPADPVELTLDKLGPAEVMVGTEFDYQIQVSNPGTVSARQLQLVDFLPEGLTLLGVAADLGWSCQSGQDRVDCQRSALEPGQSSQISLQARLDAPGDYLNRAVLTATDLASNLSDQVSTRARTAGARVDLRLRKSDLTDPIAPGDTVVYLLEVVNIGTLPATAVTLVDELPAGLTLLSASGNGWSCSGTVVCQLAGALADGASAQLRIEAQAPSNTATILNRASVSSAEPDLNPDDNVDDEQTTVTSSGNSAVADLAVSAGPTVLASAGESVVLTAEVSNLGPDSAQGMQLNGLLDPAAELLSAALGPQSCSVSGASFSCLLGGLESGTTLPVRVQVRVLQPQGGRLQLRLSSLTDDPRLANNEASVAFEIRTQGSTDLSVSGSAAPDPVPTGGIVQYQAVLRNEGPDAISDANYSIILSEGQIVLDVSGAGLSCVHAAALATCHLDGELIVGAQRQATLRAQVSAAAGSTIQAQIVNLAALDPNPTNDRVTIRVQVGERSVDDIRDQLDGAAGSDPIAGAAVSPVAEQCADPSPALVDFCDDLLQASDSEVRDALAATAPEEGLSQAVLAREVSFAQFFNIDARLAELRGASGGFSSAGLMLSGSGGSLPLGQLLAAEESADGGGLLGSPWGFFINGTISNGEQNARAQRNQVGVDFESRGVTAGVDYRFSNALTAGVALGYADFDADISGDSSIDTQGLLLTGYASWYPTERFYLDGRLSLGQIDFEQARRVRFMLDGQTTDLLARGDAAADQLSLAAGMGYHWNRGAWNITPNASLRYTDTQIDSFIETGAGAFNLRYDDTDTDSLLVAAGVQVSRAISTSRGVLTPTMSLSFNHDNNDEDLSIVARFADGGNQSFRFDAPDSDSSYGALGLGMVYVGPNGVQAYLNYRTVFGYDDFERDTINLGARFEF